MRNRTLKLSGYEFCREITIQRFNMALIAEEAGKNKQWFLIFNPGENLATIDNTMPEWYEKPAILAEAIAYGKIKKLTYKNFARRTRTTASQQRSIASQRHTGSAVKPG